MADPAPLVYSLDRSTGYMKAATVSGGAIGTPASFPPAGSSASILGDSSGTLCVGDFSGDGVDDVVFGSLSSRKIRLFARKGTGPGDYHFDPVVDVDSYTPPGEPRPSVCGDVDGDGDLDIVTSFAGSSELGNVYIYRNNGGGSFTRTSFASGLTYLAALAGKTLADFNSDGKLDLAVFTARTPGAAPSNITIYTNTGIPTAPFATASRTEIPNTYMLMLTTSPRWGALTSGDLDGDGKADLWAMGNRQELRFYKGNGNLTFAYPVLVQPFYFPTDRPTFDRLDVDANGSVDLFVASGSSSDSNRLRVFLGAGNGYISAQPSQTFEGFGSAVAVESRGCRGLFDGAPCSDGDACTAGDTCQLEQCVGGPALSCSDGNLCTADLCDKATGCVWAEVQCFPLDLDPQCAQAACNPTHGKCTVQPKPGATVCDDGNPCTDSDACSGGKCTGNRSPACPLITGGIRPRPCQEGQVIPFAYSTVDFERDPAEVNWYAPNLRSYAQLVVNATVKALDFHATIQDIPDPDDGLTLKGSSTITMTGGPFTDGIWSSPVDLLFSDAGLGDGRAGFAEMLFESDAADTGGGISITEVRTTCRSGASDFDPQPFTEIAANANVQGLLLDTGDALYFQVQVPSQNDLRVILQPLPGGASTAADFDVYVAAAPNVHPESAPPSEAFSSTRGLDASGNMIEEVVHVPGALGSQTFHIMVLSAEGRGTFRLGAFAIPPNTAIRYHQPRGEMINCVGGGSGGNDPNAPVNPGLFAYDRIVSLARATTAHVFYNTDGTVFIRDWFISNRDCDGMPSSCDLASCGSVEWTEEPRFATVFLHDDASSTEAGCACPACQFSGLPFDSIWCGGYSGPNSGARWTHIERGSWDCTTARPCSAQDFSNKARTIAHELGHALWDIPDEYANAKDLCGHSLMGLSNGGMRWTNFCNDFNHGRDPDPTTGRKVAARSNWKRMRDLGGSFPVAMPGGGTLAPGMSYGDTWDGPEISFTFVP